ncbi:MAG: Ig-like domain-containing protein, partial [Sedimentisphaerales bacterium]
MIRVNYWKKVLVLMVVGAMAWAGAAQAQTHTEDFESGYNLDQTIGTHLDWYDGGAGPTVTSGIGVAGLVGLSPANNIFNWTAHSFSWNEVIKVIIGMDFQTDGSGHFDDDRIGWTINSGNVDSANFFGVQMDPGGSGYNIEGYWDGVSAADRRPSIANLPTLSANAWYRFQVEITKLPDTSASIDVELWSLDSSGNLDTLVVSESITTDTGTLGDDAPNSKYFTSGLCPAYKNYNALEGAADNAYFHVELGELPPEPDPEGTLVSPAETVWKYLDDGSDQGTAWREPTFDDIGWDEGPAQLGYGGDGEVTTISYGTDPDNKYICYYFRHYFDVADASQVGSLKLRLVRDDGAVVYLNGAEIVRSNMPDGETIYYDTLASNVVGGDDESKWFEFDVDPAGLVDGTNVLAVEIHQINGTSTDISFNLGLAETEHIRKGPYLFYTGVNTEMKILWQVDVPQGCTLDWGTDPADLSESVLTEEFGSDHQHEYIIGGDIGKPALVPGTKYYYKVTVGYGESYTGSFTTAPAVNADNVKFLAFGDTRADAGLVPYNYDLVCEAMNTFTITNPGYRTLVLNVGDWINNDTENDWQNMFFNRSLSNALELHANMPINGCIGNHEDAGIVYDKYYPYTYEPGGRYWSFDSGPVHIAIVDQYTDYSTDSEQLTWLDNDLATSDKLWKIIVLHEPGWSVGPHPDNTSVQSYIQPLCLAHDVDIVFGGHNHNYARCDVAGIQHVTTGGGGAPLRPVNLDTNLYVVAGESTLEFCEIEIQGDTLYYTARRPDQSVIDSFEKTKPWPEASSPNPAESEQNVSLDVVLGWTAGVGAVNHDVYLGTDLSAVAAADTLSPEYETTQDGTNYGPLSLSSGTTYYWRIDEFDGTTIYAGNVWSFTTIYNPQQASNPSPAYAETGVDIDADLSWDAGAGAIDHYVYLWYEVDSEEVYVVNGDVTSETETTYSPPVLAPATTYYWRIDEFDGSTTYTGYVWSFETIAAPGQASGPSPGDAAQDVAVDADLSWMAGSDTTLHDVYFGTDSGSLSLVSEGQSETTYDPGTLVNDETYYWRIDEVGPGGTTTGAVWSFTTVPPPPPGQAANPNPADEAVDVPVDADLNWTAGTGAVKHDVYFGTDSGALPLVSEQQPLPFTSFEPGTLYEGITYYWQIDAYNSSNEKTEGVLWSFTTILPVPPDMAIPSAPVYEGSAVNVPDVGVSVILRWLSGDRAASHDVYFGVGYDLVNNATNASPEFKVNILQAAGEPGAGGVTVFTWNPLGTADLPYVSSYWWRIDEINPGGITKGDIWNFTTESDTYAPIFTYAPQVDPQTMTAHEATINWTTNEPSDSLVDYGETTSYGSSVYDAAKVTSHSVTLTGLLPNTTYYYLVTSTDSKGNWASMDGLPFTTLANTPPVAVNDSATTTEGVAVVIDVLANDSDADGDALTVESVTQGTNGSVVDNGDGTVTYTPNGAAPYIDTFTYTVNDGYFGTDTATVTVEVREPYVDYTAYDEDAVFGTVIGSYIDTQAKDSSYEVIEEALDKPNKNGASILEHKWLIDVPGTGPQSFHVNAYRDDYDDADDFDFWYSTDDLEYTKMLTVTKTADDGMYQTYALPDSISGTVYIYLSDTHYENGELVLGQVHVNHMFIRCESAGGPVDNPPVVTITSPSDGATFGSGVVISFVGTATDTEDGDLTSGLVWQSDIEGEIGTGGSFTTMLIDGEHVITTSVTDS